MVKDRSDEPFQYLTDELARRDAMSEPIRVTRELPLWGILSLIGAALLQAAGGYYALQRLGEELLRQGQRQSEMAQDIRGIASEIQKSNTETLKLGYALASLEQRVRQLEAARLGK